MIAKKDNYINHFDEYKKINLKINNKIINPHHLKNTITLYKNICDLRPLIILNFTILPIIYINLISRFIKLKSINTFTGLGAIYTQKNIKYKIIKYLLHKIVLNKDNIFCFQNKADLKYFNHILKFKRNYLVPGSGINVSNYKLNQKFISKKDKLIFLMCARLIKEKGYKEYFNSIKKFFLSNNKAEFIYIGEVNQKTLKEFSLYDFIDDGRLTIYQFLKKEELIRVLSISDCVILPSYYREGCPHILLEALVLNKPIITTVKNHSSQLIKDGFNGYKVGIKNSDALCEKLIKFANLSSSKRIEMGENSKILVKKFSIERTIKRYDDLIEQNI